MVVKVSDYEGVQPALAKLCEFLSTYGISEERIFDCKLIACELLGNVLKHDGGETGITSRVEKGCIEVKIFSQTYFALPKRIECSDVFSENGRGLYLISKLCKEIISEADGIRVRITIDK